jgi:hypothetical protein
MADESQSVWAKMMPSFKKAPEKKSYLTEEDFQAALAVVSRAIREHDEKARQEA